MIRIRSVLSGALGLALAVAGLAVAPAAANSVPAPSQARAATTATAGYGGGGGAAEQAASRALFETIWAAARQRQAAEPGIQLVTLTYNDSQAPSFQQEIDDSTGIWNSSVGNVQLREVSGEADFSYREGTDPRGSHAVTDGRGHGYIFIDLPQSREYDALRIVAHETGHILGLPDHYSGPCSELMSGHGPGTGCTNAQPDANESARVDALWANGLSSAVESSAVERELVTVG